MCSPSAGCEADEDLLSRWAAPAERLQWWRERVTACHRLLGDATSRPVNVIFVEPGFPANQRRFALALASVGADVIGIGESEEWQLDDELRDALSGYYRVGSVTSQHEP